MDPWKRPNIELKKIAEVYPKVDSMNPLEQCQNGAKTVSLKQRYYMCEDRLDPSYILRIDQKSYEYATTLPYYVRIAKCYDMLIEQPACWCPKGFTGALCSEAR